jgi:DNA-binding MarR family transcriptional regulator
VTGTTDVHDVAAALQVSVGLLVRRLRQTRPHGDLTMPEMSALARLDRGGPATPASLARAEEISPQSMGATIAALESRGLVRRSPDPDDARCVIVAATQAGLTALRDRRSERTDQLARALSAGFTRAELDRLLGAALLLERLAQGV